MSFSEWITSSAENPAINGRWGWLHITTLILCIAIIVTLSLVFYKRSDKSKRIVLWILAGLIFVFEITRRIVNFVRATDITFDFVLWNLLPRPWCAISCWVVMASLFVNKKFFYNFVSVTSLLCTIIFFAYPAVGFNNKYILFENLYSIVTHSLLLISSILLITFKFTDFKYRTIWKEAICLAAIIVYAILEIYVLKIEADPMYFMPGNDAQIVFGLSYAAYIPLYIIVIFAYCNAFYLIGDRNRVFKKRIKK